MTKYAITSRDNSATQELHAQPKRTDTFTNNLDRLI